MHSLCIGVRCSIDNDQSKEKARQCFCNDRDGECELERSSDNYQENGKGSGEIQKQSGNLPDQSTDFSSICACVCERMRACF